MHLRIGDSSINMEELKKNEKRKKHDINNKPKPTDIFKIIKTKKTQKKSKQAIDNNLWSYQSNLIQFN